MKAPDKIYVREYPDGLNQFWDRKKRDDVVATIYHEYIRKDALLEWWADKFADSLLPGMTITKYLTDFLESL